MFKNFKISKISIFLQFDMPVFWGIILLIIMGFINPVVIL